MYFRACSYLLGLYKRKRKSLYRMVWISLLSDLNCLLQRFKYCFHNDRHGLLLIKEQDFTG